MAEPRFDRARLHVEGVATPIVTRVAERRHDGMTVRQPLPFLEVGTRVRDDGAVASRIHAVRVEVVDGVPNLLIELRHEADRDLTVPVQHRVSELAMIQSQAVTKGPGRPMTLLRRRTPLQRLFDGVDRVVLAVMSQLRGAPAAVHA